MIMIIEGTEIPNISISIVFEYAAIKGKLTIFLLIQEIYLFA